MTATAFNVAGTADAADHAAAAAAVANATVTADAAHTDGIALRPSTAASDPRGCPVSTTSHAAIDHLEQAMWRLASYFGDPLADLDAAIVEDPAWILPYLVKANALLTMAEQRFNRMAEDCLAAGRRRQPRPRPARRASRRTWRRPVPAWRVSGALPAISGTRSWWITRRTWRRCCRRTCSTSTAATASTCASGWRGCCRTGRRRRRSTAIVLGQYAFGLEECNLYPQALEAGERALALERRDPWAVHAVAHVHEMLGRYEEGARWLASRESDWSPDNGFAFHNWWHLALFHVEKLDTDAALRIFDEHVAPGAELALQQVDAAALLWRLTLMDVDVGDRWSRLAPVWPAAAPDAGFYSFNDLHAVLTHVGAGDIGQARRILDIATAGAGAATTCGAAAADTGVPLMRSVIALAEGRPDEARGRAAGGSRDRPPLRRQPCSARSRRADPARRGHPRRSPAACEAPAQRAPDGQAGVAADGVLEAAGGLRP